MSGSRRHGFSLVEVVVALVLLEICLVGVLGLFALAAGRMARAVLVERAAAEVAAVADSLSRAGAGAGGASARGPWRIEWEAQGGGALVVRAILAADSAAEPVVEVRVP